MWRNCTICKSPIQLGAKYYLCSVSSCHKKRSPTQFCSVKCWDVHRSYMNHQNSGADEYTAPKFIEPEKEIQTNKEASVKRKIIQQPLSQTQTPSVKSTNNKEILIVASKLKAFIKEESGLNTSAEVMDRLSDIVRKEALKAIENAKRAERKTVMSRDFQN